MRRLDVAVGRNSICSRSVYIIGIARRASGDLASDVTINSIRPISYMKHFHI